MRLLLSEFKFNSLGELAKSFKIDHRWPQITSDDNNNHQGNHKLGGFFKRALISKKFFGFSS